eukprot:scaffold43553_cov75-Attheya_sp.AAC.1
MILDSDRGEHNAGFQHDGNPLPTLQFRRLVAKEMVENTGGLEQSDDGKPQQVTSNAPTIVPCAMVKVKHYCGQYNKPMKKIKKLHRNIKRRGAQTCNTPNCKN